MPGMQRWPALRDALIGGGCHALSVPFRRGRGRQPLDAPSRLVIIKPASLGDVLMATPAVRALREALPDAHLAFAVGSWSRPMVAGNPRLDAVVDLGAVGSGRYGAVEYRQAVRHLRAGRYDAAIVLDRAPLITLLPFLAGIPWRVGLDSDGRGFSLSTGVLCPPGRHEVDLYLGVVRAAGYGVREPRLEFFPTAADEAAASAALAEAGVGLAEGEQRALVAIHPGGGVNPGMTLLAKRWPVQRFAALADRLRTGLGATVVLVGGPDDRPVVAELRAAMQERAVDLAGKLTWGELGVLLRCCRLLIGNDTGTAHLAGAVGTRAVVVFGPTDPVQYGPYGGRGEAVTAGVPCAPCFHRGRFPPCPYAYRCLVELEVDAVWGAVLRQWEAGTTNPAPVRHAGGGE